MTQGPDNRWKGNSYRFSVEKGLIVPSMKDLGTYIT